MSHPNSHHDNENVRSEDSKFSPKAKALKNNRIATGHWGKEVISRPKTLAERYPNDKFLHGPKSKTLKK